MTFRVRVPGYGDIYVFAANQQEAIVKAQQWANQNGISTESGNFTLTPFSAGSIPQGAVRIGFGNTPAQPSTGPGSPTEEQNNPSGFPAQSPAGPDIGGGDPSDQPTGPQPGAHEDELGSAPAPTSAFWRVNIPGYGNVFFQGTQDQAVQAALRFTEENGLQVEGGALDSLSAVATSQDNFNSGLRVGIGGNTISGYEGSWLQQLQDSQGGQPTGETGEVTPPGNGQGPAGTTPEQQTPTATPDLVTPEEASPFGAFQNFIQSEGYNPAGPLGRQLAGQFGQLEGSYALQGLLGMIQSGADQAINPDTGEPFTPNQIFGQGIDPVGFIDYLDATSRDQRAQMSLDALQMLASGQLGQAQYGEGGEPLSVLALLAGANPEAGGNAGQVANDINSTALEALGTRLSPYLARRYGGALINESERLYSQALASYNPALGQSEPSYVGQLLTYLGLG